MHPLLYSLCGDSLVELESLGCLSKDVIFGRMSNVGKRQKYNQAYAMTHRNCETVDMFLLLGVL